MIHALIVALMLTRLSYHDDTLVDPPINVLHVQMYSSHFVEWISQIALLSPTLFHYVGAVCQYVQ